MSARLRDSLGKWSRIAGLAILSGLFLLAGVSKAIDPTQFLFSIEGYRILPGRLEHLAALYLPWFEITLGLGVWVPRLRAGALLGVSGLLLGFTGAITSVWLRGIDIDCGCFSSILPDAGYALTILRNLVLLGIAAALLVRDFRRASGR